MRKGPAQPLTEHAAQACLLVLRAADERPPVLSVCPCAEREGALSALHHRNAAGFDWIVLPVLCLQQTLSKRECSRPRGRGHPSKP
jgi:hypothetical protein